jgi:ubiquinone/menaquinone biosynthesis C-methylase UbiE
MPAMNDLAGYYARRAAEYEKIYKRPDQQADLARLEAHLVAAAGGHDVLEMACGTGWWTERMARSARTITAFDPVPEVLERARARGCPAGKVRFRSGDAFRLEDIGGHFSLVVAAFLWSHIPRREIPVFLEGIARRFPEGVRVVFVDTRWREGYSTPIARRDAWGNTWQVRRLEDGGEFEIIKNFPTADELSAVARAQLTNVNIRLLECFWILEADTIPVAPEPEADEPKR